MAGRDRVFPHRPIEVIDPSRMSLAHAGGRDARRPDPSAGRGYTVPVVREMPFAIAEWQADVW